MGLCDLQKIALKRSKVGFLITHDSFKNEYCDYIAFKCFVCQFQFVPTIIVVAEWMIKD